MTESSDKPVVAVPLSLVPDEVLAAAQRIGDYVRLERDHLSRYDLTVVAACLLGEQS